MATHAITNVAFGEAVECHHSMASRILNGKRLPSLELIERIANVYDLPLTELLDARRQGAPELGRYLQRTVIDPADKASV